MPAKGQKMSQEYKDKIRAARIGQKLSDESKRKISEARKRYWQQFTLQERQEMTADRIIKMRNALGTISKVEDAVANALDTMNISYIRQYEISRTHVDFFLPEYHIVLEVYGCYWHGCKSCGFADNKRLSKNIARQKFIESQDYVFRYIWEHDVNKNTRLAIANRLNVSRKEES